MGVTKFLQNGWNWLPWMMRRCMKCTAILLFLLCLSCFPFSSFKLAFLKYLAMEGNNYV